MTAKNGATKPRARGRPCSICAHPRRTEIDEAEGQRITSVAKAFGVPRKNLERHRAHANAVAPVHTSVRDPGVPAAPSTSPREVTLATLTALQSAMGKAPAADYPRLANAITAATKLLAKLSGDIELTEAQVLRSAAFKRVRERMAEVLARFPECAKAMAQAFAEDAAR